MPLTASTARLDVLTASDAAFGVLTASDAPGIAAVTIAGLLFESGDAAALEEDGGFILLEDGT